MSLIRKIKQRRIRRAFRAKRVISKREEGILRISVFRSVNHLYAQAINDEKGHTVSSCSSSTMSTGTKIERAFETGKKLAEQLLALEVKKVVLDRSRYLYHGRVKALADGIRSAGIEL